MHRGIRGILLAVALVSDPLVAQTATPATKAAAIITPEAIAQHISTIAHDSMQGRDTPSRGLELTAQYIAEQFQRLNLSPDGAVTRGRKGVKLAVSWFDRYRIPGNRRLDHAQSQLAIVTYLDDHSKRIVEPLISNPPKAQRVLIDFATAARFVSDTISITRDGEDWGGGGTAFIVAGPHTLASVRKVDLQNRVVLYLPPVDMDSAARQGVIKHLSAANDVLVLSDEDSITFTTRQQAARRRPLVVIDNYMERAVGVYHWVVHVDPKAIQSALTTTGIDIARIRTESTPIVRELTRVQIKLKPSFMNDSTTPTGVNVVGIIKGTDPKRDAYNQEHILIVAHMDHAGVTHGSTDSIYNGANDNASGIAGLIELAKAFSQPGAQPRRSIIFLATSGSAKEFWGSNHWAAYRLDSKVIVAGINLDMIGREAHDSIRVSGLNDFNFTTRPDWIAGAHPELRLTLVDGGTIYTPRSEPFAFLSKMLPMLSFHNGTHTSAPMAEESLTTIDTEQQARILRLVYYVSDELANTNQGQLFNSDARLRWRQAFGRQEPP